MAKTSETRLIKIQVDAGKSTATLKKMSREMAGLNKGVRRIDKRMKSFGDSLRDAGQAFAGFAAAFGVREIARAIDEFQLLNDRIISLVGNAEEASSVMKGLATAAKFTNSSISGLAESYNRVSLAVSDLGVSSDAVLGLTTALQQTFRLSGSTIAEATGATIQLTQGLSAGALRGQELRSVLESNAVLSGLLAEKFGVARGQLIKLAESGAITAQKVFEILGDNFDSLNERAGKLGRTFEQSIIYVFDQFKLQLLAINKELNLSGGFSSAMDQFVDQFVNADNILRVFGAVTLPLIAGGISLVSKAILSNPLGAALSLLGFAIADLAYNWEKRTLQMKIAWLELKTFLEGANTEIKTGLNILDEFIKDMQLAASGIIPSIKETWNDLTTAVNGFTEGMIESSRQKGPLTPDQLTKMGEYQAIYRLTGAKAHRK